MGNALTTDRKSSGGSGQPKAVVPEAVSPDLAMLLELLSGPDLGELLNACYSLLNIPVTITDVHKNVLYSSPLQRICGEFHRENAASGACCTESNERVLKQLEAGQTFVMCLCKNGLVDCASPIDVDGVHVAYLFVGQFLLEPPDEERFRLQAQEFGFDVEAYLDALREVPVIDESRVESVVGLLVRATRLITKLSAQSERALEAQSRQTTILNTIPQAVFWKDLEGRYLGCNTLFAHAAGKPSPEAVVGQTDYDLTWPIDQADMFRTEDEAVISDKRPWLHIVEAITRADGTRIVVDQSKVPLLDPAGNAYALLGIWSDVTRDVQAREDLRASEERLKTAFKAGLDAFFISTLEEGLILDVNDEFESMYGYEREEVPGRTSIEIGLWVDPVDRARVVAEIKEKGFVRDMLISHRRKDGRAMQVSLSIRLIWSGQNRHILGIIRDVTEREKARIEQERLEAELRQAQKMESIGRLAGGVAHDFNNLLAVILNYASFALDEEAENEHVRSYLQQIEAAGERAATLTRQLLAFSRRQILQPEALDLGVVVRGIEKMISRLLGEDIEIVPLLADDLGAVTADPGQIEQVIMNLVVNARDAMPRGGRLVIETANVDVADSGDEFPDVKPGSYVVLVVRDNGSGMEPAVREQIFEPFFTTKTVGKGTGLGLSTVYGIVKQSGGEITVQSEPGQGSAFRVFLPRVAAATMASTPKVKRLGASGHETILLVEDEDAVRDITELMLSTAGYEVLSARDGPEALGVSRTHARSIDLLVTDLVMPHMSGRELSQVLTGERPSLKVLYVSGYTDDTISDHGVLAEGTSFLGKPFAAGELTSKVRELLDEKS